MWALVLRLVLLVSLSSRLWPGIMFAFRLGLVSLFTRRFGAGMLGSRLSLVFFLSRFPNRFRPGSQGGSRFLSSFPGLAL